MDITSLMTEWSKDSIIDENNLSGESIRMANLHSKYLNILTDYRLKSKTLEIKYNKEKIFKIEYLSGNYNNPEDAKMLEDRGLEPVREKIRSAKIQDHLDADKDLLDILMKKTVCDEIVTYCDQVLKELSNRKYSISSTIKWNIFMAGG